MKRRGWIALLAAALLATVIAVFLGFVLSGNKQVLLAQLPEPDGSRDVMTIEAEIGGDLRMLSGTQTLLATNRTGTRLHELALRLYAEAMREGSVVVSDVTVNGEKADFARDKDDTSVLRIACDWPVGATLSFAWQFSVTTTPGYGSYVKRNADSTAALFACALPVPSVWEGGAWRLDAWDELAQPGYATAFDYDLTLIAPKRIMPVFGGALTGREETPDGNVRWTAGMRGARDVSLALCEGGALRQKKTRDGVLLSALADDAGAAGRLLDAAGQSLEALSSIGIEYPFAAFSVFRMDTGSADGLIGSGLSVVAGVSDAEALRRRVTRHAARQTFGVLIENDPWKAPWLSQSLASTAELLTYRKLKGENAYETRLADEIEISTRLTRPHGVTVGAATSNFGDEMEMMQVLRDQGADLLLGIERAVGEADFMRALTFYIEENAAGFGTREKLEEALLRATGSSWAGYLSDGLNW